MDGCLSFVAITFSNYPSLVGEVTLDTVSEIFLNFVESKPEMLLVIHTMNRAKI